MCRTLWSPIPYLLCRGVVNYYLEINQSPAYVHAQIYITLCIPRWGLHLNSEGSNRIHVFKYWLWHDIFLISTVDGFAPWGALFYNLISIQESRNLNTCALHYALKAWHWWSNLISIFLTNNQWPVDLILNTKCFAFIFISTFFLKKKRYGNRRVVVVAVRKLHQNLFSLLTGLPTSFSTINLDQTKLDIDF